MSIIAFIAPGCFAIFYITSTIIWYRDSSPVVQAVIALLLHPIITEIITSFLKLDSEKGRHNHLFYDHLHFFILECTLNLFRRFLFVNTGDSTVTVVLVILSGIEEVIIRSTFEQKEYYVRKFLGKKQLTKEELDEKRKYWSYGVTSTSIIEITTIIIAAIMIIFFYDLRYIVDLGYGDQVSLAAMQIALVKSTVMQILIEQLVDFACSVIEEKQGFEKSDFFFHFRSYEIVIAHLGSLMFAFTFILFSFKTIPDSSIFCSNSNDPCSCTKSFKVFQAPCECLIIGKFWDSNNNECSLINNQIKNATLPINYNNGTTKGTTSFSRYIFSVNNILLKYLLPQLLIFNIFILIPTVSTILP